MYRLVKKSVTPRWLLFPGLREAIDEAFFMSDKSECDNKTTWVVPMLGGKKDKNLGTTFKKIIARAGVDVWPKPFQNLRSSRQTELEQDYPTYVVCKWLGNTPMVANKHYLTVTENHFVEAVHNGGCKRPFRLARCRKKKPAPPMKCGKRLLLRKLCNC